MGAKWIFSDAANPSSMASKMRRKRFETIEQALRNGRGTVTVLDLGGTAQYWLTQVCLPADIDVHITLLNLTESSVDDCRFSSVTGDARDLTTFGDASFDIVFSNSVIEHVGNASDQQRMADEARRVGSWFYVQTPNKHFPIEPHFLFPMFQYLPRSIRIGLARTLRLGWNSRIRERTVAEAEVDEICLLTPRRFRALFPGADVGFERFFGLAKSMVATGPGWPAASHFNAGRLPDNLGTPSYRRP